MLHNSYWLCCNLQFLNSVIINKAKVPFPQAYVTVTIADFDYSVQALWFYYPQNFNFALLIYQLISDFIYWHTFSPLGVLGLLFV
jgi:hypothetical protein